MTKEDYMALAKIIKDNSEFSTITMNKKPMKIITIHATDVEMLKKFIDAEYIRRPNWVSQKIVSYKKVKL